LSPVDLNIIESQKMDLRDICNVYGISSELLNDPDNKTNANKRESRMALYYETVIPELDLIRDELNRWLVPAFETDGKKYHLDYDISSIPALQADLEKQTKQLADAWWITGNEKRMLQGYDTRDELDSIFIPSNLVPWTGDVDLAEAMKGLPADYAK
jgi:phage portal protein BeeE